MNKAFNLPLRASWMRCVLCIMLAGSLAANDVVAQFPAESEIARQVMAAYLYKFGSYVVWPDEVFENSSSPITIGVVDAPELADELRRMVEGRTINGRQVLIRKLKPGGPAEGLHVLFIGGTDTGQVAGVLSDVRTQPILTVTALENGLDQGSVMNFVVVDGKLRFEVSAQAGRHNGLNISARLLVAAYKVEPEPS